MIKCGGDVGKHRRMKSKVPRRALTARLYFVLILIAIRGVSGFHVPCSRLDEWCTSRSRAVSKPSLTVLMRNGEEERKIEKTNKLKSSIKKAYLKFKSKPRTYLIIPFIAALVGWVTNWLAVQMIFYPISYIGLPLYRKPEVPLGLIGWQGIVPCKTRKMSITMVDMVTTQLLSIPKVFQRLDPGGCAELLAPEVPKLAQEIVEDVVPRAFSSLPKSVVGGLPSETIGTMQHYNKRWLCDLTLDLQHNIDSLLNVQNCVVNQMLQDKAKLGQLFQICGKKELDFLTNSGLWFGFLLGIIQMIVALFWDNPWSLSIGGTVVGYATNWLALKWIFEPIDPVNFMGFTLQGMFLKRQKEVSETFSAFFASNVLTSEKLWDSILGDPSTTPAFHELFSKHLTKFMKLLSNGLIDMTPEPQFLQGMCRRAIQKLPSHVHVLHTYVDKTLDLQNTLRTSMERMTSREFEKVLHPIFEEDELTLILAGAALGFLAGGVQQCIEVGVSFKQVLDRCCEFLRCVPGRCRRVVGGGVCWVRSKFSSSVDKGVHENIDSAEHDIDETI